MAFVTSEQLRRDVYNLEQIEVVKGPSGAEAGRGAASGVYQLSD